MADVGQETAVSTVKEPESDGIGSDRSTAPETTAMLTDCTLATSPITTNEKDTPAEPDGLAAANPADDDMHYPTGLRLGLIMLANCLSVFLISLDNSIIATAIPKITDQFNSVDDVGWYGSAYLLTTAALQLIFGKIYTFFSIKWCFIGTIALFEVGSIICGVAQNSLTLIMGRAVAGLGSAGIFSGAILIASHSVPLVKRPLYSGYIGSMYGIACVAGPLLGGVFTDKVTWRWCFFINLPIGAVSILVIAIFFPDPDRKQMAGQGGGAFAPSTAPQNGEPSPAGTDEPVGPAEAVSWKARLIHFDPIGTLLFMPAIVCLLLALQWGGTTYAWKSGRIIALFVVFALLICGFVYVQYRQQEDATVPPRIIYKRTVWASALFAFALGSSFMSAVYFLPIWFQAIKGATAVKSGLMNLPMLISLVAMSVIAGASVTHFGYYTPFMLSGTVLMTVGFGLITTFTPHTAHPRWIGYQVLAGAGIGLGMQQPLIAVQTVLDITDVPVGVSLQIFSQTLGGALFVSICENIFTNKVVAYIPSLAPGVDPRLVLATGATSIQATFANPGVTLAYSNALCQTFIVCTAMAALTLAGGLLVEWNSVKGQELQGGMA